MQLLPLCFSVKQTSALQYKEAFSSSIQSLFLGHWVTLGFSFPTLLQRSTNPKDVKQAGIILLYPWIKLQGPIIFISILITDKDFPAVVIIWRNKNSQSCAEEGIIGPGALRDQPGLGD